MFCQGCLRIGLSVWLSARVGSIYHTAQSASYLLSPPLCFFWHTVILRRVLSCLFIRCTGLFISRHHKGVRPGHRSCTVFICQLSNDQCLWKWICSYVDVYSFILQGWLTFSHLVPWFDILSHSPVSTIWF